MLLCSWSAWTRRILSSGATRATTPISRQLLGELLVGQRGELGAGEGPALDAQLLADGRGGHRVVAGDHAHLDAGAVALGDGRPWPRPGADRRCRPSRGGSGRASGRADRRRARTSSGSKSRRATTITRSPDCAMRSFSAMAAARWSVRRCRGRRRRATSSELAAVDEHVGRALDEAAHHRLARSVGHLVEGRHELVLGVERHLGHARVALAGAVEVDAALGGQHDQRALGRVADQVAASSSRASAHSAIGSSASSRSTVRPPSCLISPVVP